MHGFDFEREPVADSTLPSVKPGYLPAWATKAETTAAMEPAATPVATAKEPAAKAITPFPGHYAAHRMYEAPNE